MNIEVAIDYLPGIYEKYLGLYDEGVPLDKLDFKQMSGGRMSTVECFIMLYEAIKTNGYREVGECKFRSDISEEWGKYRRITPIKGLVDFHGHLVIDGGHHRLSIFKFLRYKSAIITLHNVDPAFEKFYGYMLDFQHGKTQMYHSIDYWACSMWPCARGSNRTEFILPRLVSGSTVLDLGCHIGGVSHPLSVEGHKVTGVDQREDSIYCANYLADHYVWRDEAKELYPNQFSFLPSFPNYHRPSYLLGDINDVITGLDEFDYTLFLSIYRWVGQSSKILKRIGDITRKSIFIDVEPHLEDGFKRNILKFTRFTHINKIGVENVGPKMGRGYSKPRTMYEIS